ncbi:MAG: haloacid dehalogenase-like hydrolase [Myxococcales bacterium]|nr:MAG: haloacid dehalogenase-like hydrolase [Myxococcales bacterium]
MLQAQGLRLVAVFDWDNTVIKNDVGDAVFFWMLVHNQILAPEGGDWRKTSPYLTLAAAEALGTACGSTAAGQPVQTARNVECAETFLAIYLNATTPDGWPAFGGFQQRWMEPAYAWAAQLMAGRPPDEMRTIAAAAIEAGLAAPAGATQMIGRRPKLAAYLRIYPQMQDLIRALSAAGVEVWIVSASAQVVVEPFAARLGIPPERVVGVRTILDSNSRLTARLEGCGPVADGENRLMTYMDGKRCWINKAIFGDRGPEAIFRVVDLQRRIVFGAGDSQTDATFLRDATELRLVVDRRKAELMCYALANDDGKWLVQPMFIEPKAPRADPYPCATAACVSPTGELLPCLDSAGKVIPDQGGKKP